MSLDWIGVDALLQEAFATWRMSHARLRHDAVGARANPLEEALARAPSAEELAGFDDPLADALAAWRRQLDREHDDWPAQCTLWRAWQSKGRTEDGQELSLLDARRAWMAAKEEKARERLGPTLIDRAAHLGDLELDSLQLRMEGDGAAFTSVAGLVPEQEVALAAAVLDRTDDAAAETMRRGWVAGCAASLGRAASEGWPARLTGRWLTEVLAPGGLGAGLRPLAPPLPEVLGASSFARALGNIGAALLEAARPRSVPWSLHRLPAGTRHHARFALLAGITATLPFARRVLVLGQDRAQAHQRAMTAALLASVRLDALRVLVAAALPHGKAAARDRATDLGQRLFGESAPNALVAVMPRLHADDGRRLVGALLAVAQDQALTERHDLDWFRNPRAAGDLRDADARIEEPLELAAPRQLALVEDLARTVEARLG